jgi:hypothetical protein
VWFSADKEPNYFCSDLSDAVRLATSEEEYLRKCFSGVREHHIAVGEGSVLYLRSECALAGIRAFAPDARIIVMLRNPVDMAFSMHAQLIVSLMEDEVSFERAWALQDARRAGLHIPSTCVEPRVLQYRELCMLGEQLQRVLAIFPRDQVHTILFEDFVGDTRSAYLSVLRFLGLPDDGQSTFLVEKEGRMPRSSVVVSALGAAARRLNPAYQRVTKAFGLRRTGLNALLGSVITRKSPRPPLAPETRAMLAGTFRDDVQRLSELVGRDLSAWQLD